MKGKTKQFELWYAYYDSLFLSNSPKISFSFYEEYLYHQYRHFVPEAVWNDEDCQILAKTYQYIENFIKDPSNWTISQCKLEQLETVQTEINNLLIFLSMEKSYAYLFWKTDRRRVEASVAHLYTFLQMLIQAIIPYPTMNIFQCKTANKLCTQISKLQKLINVVVKCINPMARFLSGSRFEEQGNIIKNFFENMMVFMKKLPQIKRNKLYHIHNLTKFVVLTNPIQICTGSNNSHQGIRKKSNTVGAQMQHKSYPDSSANYQIDKFFEVTDLVRSYSCVELEKHRRTSNLGNVFYYHNYKLFNFPQKIVQHAREEQIRKKALSLESPKTLKNKKESLQKNKTETTYQTTVPMRIQKSEEKIVHPRKRQKARSYIQTRNQPVTIRPPNNTINVHRGQLSNKRLRFYERQSERDSEQMSIRSQKQSTIRKRELSIHTQSHIQRKKSEINQNDEFFYQSKVSFSINDGTVAKSKWDIVRAWLKERIQLRKIGAILLQ